MFPHGRRGKEPNAEVNMTVNKETSVLANKIENNYEGKKKGQRIPLWSLFIKH